MSESGSNPWKIFAIGCGVILLLACCCGTLGMLTCGGAVMGPHSAVHGFFRTTRTGTPDAAYDMMTPSFQASHPREGFAAEITAIAPLTTHTDATIRSLNAMNLQTTASGALTTPSGDVPFTLELEQSGPGYKIRSVTVGTQSLR